MKDPSTYCTQYVIKPEVKAWLDEYAKDQYIWIQRKRDTRGRINFFDKDAALMFKLTWGGK